MSEWCKEMCEISLFQICRSLKYLVSRSSSTDHFSYIWSLLESYKNIQKLISHQEGTGKEQQLFLFEFSKFDLYISSSSSSVFWVLHTVDCLQHVRLLEKSAVSVLERKFSLLVWHHARPQQSRLLRVIRDGSEDESLVIWSVAGLTRAALTSCRLVGLLSMWGSKRPLRPTLMMCWDCLRYQHGINITLKISCFEASQKMK